MPACPALLPFRAKETDGSRLTQPHFFCSSLEQKGRKAASSSLCTAAQRCPWLEVEQNLLQLLPGLLHWVLKACSQVAWRVHKPVL